MLNCNLTPREYTISNFGRHLTVNENVIWRLNEHTTRWTRCIVCDVFVMLRNVNQSSSKEQVRL